MDGKEREEKEDVQERVESSCNIRPACRIRRYDGEGGCAGSVQSITLSDPLLKLGLTECAGLTRRPH